MYVRAISNISGMIFSSMVYSTVNLGWYTKYIVHGESYCPEEIADRSICIDGDIGEVFDIQIF